MASETSILDRSQELAFSTMGEEAVETLLRNRVVIIRDVLGSSALEGIEAAYKASRRHDLPRRIAGRALAETGFGRTDLYRRLRVSEITLSLERPAPHMSAAMPAIEAIIDLSAQFFRSSQVAERYPNSTLNTAVFGISRGDVAFSEHQDSLGATGLAFAAQQKPALWRIHKFMPECPYPPAPIDYTFTTNAGAVVVLMQREGPVPQSVSYRQLSREFEPDGSLIHSGVNLGVGDRFIMGVFNQEVNETI